MRPAYSFAPRSKTTALILAFLAFSAISFADFSNELGFVTGGFAASGGSINESRALVVIDNLGSDVLIADVDAEAWALGSAMNFSASTFCAKCGVHYFFPAFPALRRITSSTYLIPLPLYGSGFFNARISAAT